VTADLAEADVGDAEFLSKRVDRRLSNAMVVLLGIENHSCRWIGCRELDPVVETSQFSDHLAPAPSSLLR
jgi:hypothetical protein